MTLNGPATIAPASTLSASAHRVSIEDALRAHLARILAPARALPFATLSATLRHKV